MRPMFEMGSFKRSCLGIITLFNSEISELDCAPNLVHDLAHYLPMMGEIASEVQFRTISHIHHTIDTKYMILRMFYV